MKKVGSLPIWKTVLTAIAVSTAIALFFIVVYSPDVMSNNFKFWAALNLNITVGLAYFFLLWQLVSALNRRFSWHERPGLRLLLEFLGLLCVVLVISTTTFTLWGLAEGRTLSEIRAWISVEKYVNQSYVPIIVTLFVEARGFLLNWREALLRAEKLKFSDLQTRHSYLQNQIKPHFLFNSLNVLATLVHKDANLAEKFVHELSKLYRRLLESGSREVVPLPEEMEALQSYVFLIKMRFGDALQVELGDFGKFRDKQIPPFTLQLLLENAVKHNDMAKDLPVRVRVDFADDYAIVSNTLRPKAHSSENSTGIGLKNLQERYDLLSTKPVIVATTNDLFVVKIPLLEIEDLHRELRQELWSSNSGNRKDSWEKSERLAKDGSVVVEEKWSSRSPDGDYAWSKQQKKT